MNFSSIFKGYSATKSLVSQTVRVLTLRPRFSQKTLYRRQWQSTYTREKLQLADGQAKHKNKPVAAQQPVLQAPRKLRKLKPSDLVHIPVKMDPNEFGGTMCLGDLPPAQQRLVDSVLKPGTWGGEVELNGLAKMLGVKIHVCQVLDRADKFQDVKVKVRNVINPDAKDSIYVTYDGAHYNALHVALYAHDEDTGKLVGDIGVVPGDGDCMFHAVAEAANINGLKVMEMLRQQDALYLMVMGNARFLKAIPKPHRLAPNELVHAVRMKVADTLRRELSQHLRRPEYAEMAQLIEAGGV